MTAVRRSVTAPVPASPAVVWRLVSDVTRVGEWSPETASAAWVSGEPGTVGARFKGRNKRGRSSWSTTCQVVESEPGRSFAFVVGKPAKPSASWRYEIAPAPGGSSVTESFELPKPLGAAARLFTRLTTGVRDRESDLVQGMEQTLARLAAVAEREAAQSPGSAG